MDKNDPIVVALLHYAQAQQAAAENFLAEMNDLLTEDEAEAPKPPAKKATPAKKTAAPAKKTVSKAKPEPEADEDEAAESSREDELNAMRLPQLRALAVKKGYKKDEVADADKETLVAAILEDEEKAATEEDAEEPDEAADDTDADEEVQFDRSDLQTKGLRELKALAKTAGYETSDYNGLDKDSLIDLLLGEADEAEESDEDEEEGYTEEEIRAMSLADLKQLAKDAELEVGRGWKAKDYADALVALLSEEDEEE